MKSIPVNGVVYNLCKNALSRSFAIKVAENKVINANPKIVIPGVSVLISNKSTGMFACNALNSKSNIKGNPSPKNRVIGSRRISLKHLFEKVRIFIFRPP